MAEEDFAFPCLKLQPELTTDNAQIVIFKIVGTDIRNLDHHNWLLYFSGLPCRLNLFKQSNAAPIRGQTAV